MLRRAAVVITGLAVGMTVAMLALSLATAAVIVREPNHDAAWCSLPVLVAALVGETIGFRNIGWSVGATAAF